LNEFGMATDRTMGPPRAAGRSVAGVSNGAKVVFTPCCPSS
jgi:hypothetical protein